MTAKVHLRTPNTQARSLCGLWGASTSDDKEEVNCKRCLVWPGRAWSGAKPCAGNSLRLKVEALEAQAKEHTALIERLATEVFNHRADLEYLKARDDLGQRIQAPAQAIGAAALFATERRVTARTAGTP